MLLGSRVEVGGLIGLIVFTVAAGKLLGESDLVLAQAFEFDRHMIGGLLLATVVWLWWQYDRDKVVYEIADCVTDIMKETGVAPREAVLRCYREIGNDDGESGIEPNSFNGQMFLAAFTEAAQQNAATEERRAVSRFCCAAQTAVGCSVTLKWMTRPRSCAERDKDIRDSQANGRDGEEIDGYHLPDMIAQKRHPCLRRLPIFFGHQLRNSALETSNPSFQQFSMDALPQIELGAASGSDQPSNLPIRSRPSWPFPLRQSPPIAFEGLALPYDYRLRLNGFQR